MWKLGVMLVIGMLVVACGGSDGSTGGEATDTAAVSATQTPDPCTLAGDAVLEAYFGEVFVGEPSEAGPIDSCTWRDANANSLLIQVASDHALTKPDPCEGCIALSYGDDGYAAESPFQSSATFVSGSSWYSVTTTGFRDDAASIAALGETIFTNATS